MDSETQLALILAKKALLKWTTGYQMKKNPITGFDKILDFKYCVACGTKNDIHKKNCDVQNAIKAINEAAS